VHQYPDILYALEQRVAIITLNRPDKLNAWTPAMQDSLQQAVQAAVGDADVRVILITGAGRGFCAGADMGNLQRLTAGQGREQAAAGAEAANTSNTSGPDVSADYVGRFGYLLAAPKPVIAAINGACAGIGLVLALHCDLRFAAADAKFTTAFAQRGLVAEHGISWLLPRITGVAHSLDLLFSARKFQGDEAQRLNLVNRSFTPELFWASVMEYATELAQNVSPRSLAVMKAQVWSALLQNFNTAVRIGDEQMRLSFASEDFKEGVAHFLERRAARFTGR
jgi:enoyl-CoA hydratase/carnithine racemase